MQSPIYIGDEVNGAGYRLAGARVQVPEPGRALAALDTARATAPLVLLSVGVAAEIPAAALSAALTAVAPLTLVVPDPVRGTPMPDLAARLRAQLGMEG